MNEIVGIDLIYMPTHDQKTRPVLNIIDWGTKFQMLVPVINKKPETIRSANMQWLRFFGPPQTVAIDLGREFRAIFEQRCSQDGSCVEPSAVEQPQQRAITERHGKTAKFMLMKAMDEHSCRSGAEWEALLDVVMMMKNRLMLKDGFSPVQRVLGYAPRLPGGFLTGDPGNHAMPS